MTSTFCCSFDCGVFGPAGAHWQIGAGSPAFDGGMLRCAASGSPTYALTGIAFHASRYVGRVNLTLATLPSGDCFLVADGGLLSGAFFQASDSKVYAKANGTLGATGVAVTAGVPIRLDVAIDRSAGVTVDVQVDGTAAGQATNTTSGSNNAAYALGLIGSVSGEAVFDDYLQGATMADYPFGEGFCLSFVADRDGTHTATNSNIATGTLATPVGAQITSATTDAYTYVNARPIGGGATDATRLINQHDEADEYVEVGCEPSAAAPRAVEVLIADRQATTQVGNFMAKLHDGSTDTVIVSRQGEAGSLEDRYLSKQFGGMTQAQFNALTVRFGYSTDARPDQYWRGVLIEAEFAG